MPATSSTTYFPAPRPGEPAWAVLTDWPALCRRALRMHVRACHEEMRRHIGKPGTWHAARAREWRLAAAGSRAKHTALIGAESAFAANLITVSPAIGAIFWLGERRKRRAVKQ